MRGLRSIKTRFKSLKISSKRDEDPDWDDLSSHTYLPLASPSTIRVLRLEPGVSHGPIRCSLIHVDIDTNPQFEAISYAWGPETPTRYVICDGKRREIRQNLFDALMMFRYSDRPRQLWADAICIDQQNDQERCSQVQLMGQIYSRANKTLIWLGHESPSMVQTALNYLCQSLRENRDEISKLWGGSDGDARMTYTLIKSTYSWKGKEVHKLKKTSDADAARRIGNESKSAIVRLFQNDYFQRGWVIQEVVLSKDAEIFWGHGEIWVMWLGFAARVLSTLKSSTLIYERAAWSGLSKFCSMFDLRMNMSGDSLLGLLKHSRGSCFSDPLDRIYGMLAVRPRGGDRSQDDVTIEPIYGISVLQCYEALAKEYLMKDYFWSIFSAVHHDEYLDPNWPSWVPDLRICANAVEIYQILNLRKWVMDHEHATVTMSTHGVHNCISLKGVRVAVLDRIMGRSAWQESDEHLRHLLRELSDRHSEAHVAWTATVGKSSSEAFVWKPRGEVAAGYRDEQDYGPHLINYALFTRKIPTEVVTSLSGTLALDMPPDAFSALNFSFKSRQALTGRCFFETKENWLGVGPEVMQLGDTVVLFLGCPIPFVLRPEIDGLWRLVGECYVDEIAVEQVMEKRTAPAELVEDFCIY